MKSRILTWVAFLGLAAGVVVLFALSKKQQAELAQLRQEKQELQNLQAQSEEAKAANAQNENTELAQLRKENEELMRLRNEVRQLREDRQRLGKEVQTAQAQAQNAQAQAQNAQVQAQNAEAQAQALRATVQSQQPAGFTSEQQASFARRYGLAPNQVASDQDKLNACVNFLRQIDGAKQQWALENRKTAEAVPTAQDLAPYLRANTIPACPGGGTYTLNAVGQLPLCSIPGHALPK